MSPSKQKSRNINLDFFAITIYKLINNVNNNNNNNKRSEMITDGEPVKRDGKSREENDKLSSLVSSIVNRLFSNNQVFVRSLDDVDRMLIQLVDVVKRANFNVCSPLLTNSLLSMIYNLIELKLQSNDAKYLDICLLSDLAECLVDFIGRLDKINTVNNQFI